MQYYNGKEINLADLNRSMEWRFKTLAERKISSAVPTSGKRDSCPICSTKESKKYILMHDTSYLECATCGHLYIEDIIKEDSIQEIYDSNDEQKKQYLSHFIDEKVFDKRLKMIVAPKVEFVQKHIKNALNKKWLDIGCGGCELLLAAKNAGFEVKGVEPGILGVKQGKIHGIEVTQLFINKANARSVIDNSQIISLIGVLEHLPNPLEILYTITSTVSEGTYFVIEVPRHPSLSGFVATMFPNDVVRHLIIPDHIHIFTEKSLENMLKKCSLEIETIWRFGQDFYELLSMMAQQANSEINLWPQELFASVNDVQQVLDKNGLSDSMLVIARKTSTI